MPHITRATKIKIAMFFVALFVGEFFHILAHLRPIHNFAAEIYCAILLAWAYVTSKRILQKQSRFYFVAGALFLVLLFLLRILRYNLTPSDSLPYRLVWYAYYVPFTAAPLCSFSAATFAGRSEEVRTPRYIHALWIAYLLLNLIILTNDFHMTVFQIQYFEVKRYVYRHGWMYIAGIVVWCLLLGFSSVAILVRRCALSGCKKLWFVPILGALPGMALLVWYTFNNVDAPKLFGIKIYNFQEVLSLAYIGAWESAIQIGLIPTNTDYEAIFRGSHLNALITDREDRLLAISEGQEVPSAEQLAEAKNETVALNDGLLLRSSPIQRGTVYWTEDISAVLAANRAIAQAVEYLEDEQSLLIEERNIRSKLVSYAAQNMLYESIAPVVRPQLATILRLLNDAAEDDDTFSDRLLKAMLLGVYVKRRVNLALLASRSELIDLQELRLAIYEAVEYMQLRKGSYAVMYHAGEQKLPANRMVLIFDFIEMLIETAMPDMDSMLITVRNDRKLRVDVQIGTPSDMPDLRWRAEQIQNFAAAVTYAEEDGVLLARLQFEEAAS